MKLTKHAWSLWGIALVAVLAAALLIPFEKANALYWISFVCLLMMFALCALVFVRAFREKDTLESKLLGWPLFKVACVALAGDVCLGFLLMALSTLCPLWLGVLLEILLFAAGAFCLVARDAAREVVAQSETIVVDTTVNWKALRSRMAALAAKTNREDIRKLAEEMRYADPTPTSLDEEIARQLEALELTEDQNVETLSALLRQRKPLAKAEKQNR